MRKWPVLALAAFVYLGGHQALAATGSPAASGSETSFIHATLADMGAPATQANAGSLAAWFRHEWPAWPPGAANNPLDTTLAAPGSTAFNTFDGDLHVQNFPTPAEGAEATARTLQGYPGIVADLRSGRGLCGDPSLAGEFGTWSGGGYSGVC